jgi:hypothetical protein
MLQPMIHTQRGMESSPSSASLARGALTLRERGSTGGVDDRSTAVRHHHAALRRATSGRGVVAAQQGVGIEHVAKHQALQANHAAAAARAANERAAELARENQKMVDKITRTVLQAPSPYGQSSASTAPYSKSRHAAPFVHRSLNLGRRRAEQERIAAENLVLARRIITRKPTVVAQRELEKHATLHERLLKERSRYVELPPTQAQLLQAHTNAMYAQAALTGRPTPPFPGGAPAAAAGQMPFQLPAQLPPGYTQEMYMQFMQQQMMLQMQAAAGATGHAGSFHPQQQQQQQQYFQPMPPGYGRPGSASSVSTLGSGGPLAPLADAQQRSARLQRKVIAAEHARLQKSERLLRPLRSLPDSTQPPPHSMASIIPSSATSASSSSFSSSPSPGSGGGVPAFHHANLAQLHTPSALASQSHSRSESRVSERSAAPSAPHASAQQQSEQLQQPAQQQQQQPPPPPPVIAANPEPIFVLRKAQQPSQTHGDEKES